MTKKITHYLAFLLFLGGIETSFAQVPCGPNVSLSFSQTNVSCFGGNNGTATAIVSGGSGSYMYSWVPLGATTATASNLSAGTYTAYVLDNGGGGIDTVYLEDFDGTQTWTLNTPTGTNDTDPNQWMVSDDEGGVLPTGCGVANNGNATLYVVATGAFGSSGASYNAGGLCSFGICVTSNYRAESPNISTLGYSSMTLAFDYIGVGDGLNDNASLVYSTNGGSTWTTLAASLKSNTCANGQGQWTAASYNLPATCNNISNLRIGFVWTNNDDGVGTDPSFACNNIQILGSTGTTTACYVTGNVNITQPTALGASTTSVATACQGQNNGSATATPSGGTIPYTYSWSNGQTTATATGLAAGNYTCVVKDANNCTYTVSATVVAGAVLNFTTGSSPTSCNGGNDGSASVTVTNGTSPITYTWSNGQTGANINNLVAGTYACVFTTANGCTGTASVVVTEPAAMVLTPTLLQPNCAGQTTGNISLVVSGGTPNYTYSWNTGLTTANISNLGTGTYTCLVTDGKGCTQTYSGTITAPTPISLTLSATSANPLGTATATVSGGTPPYTYSWNTTPPQSTVTATNLAPGQYICIVTDSKGCVKQAPVSVESGVAIESESIGISQLLLYPNPSDGTLTWEVELQQPQDISLSVYDVNGKQLFYITEKNALMWHDSRFVPNLSQGIYFLKISTQQGEMYQKWQIK